MSKNDITGDSLRSKSLSEEGKANWDLIFGKKVPPYNPIDFIEEMVSYRDENGTLCEPTKQRI